MSTKPKACNTNANGWNVGGMWVEIVSVAIVHVKPFQNNYNKSNCECVLSRCGTVSVSNLYKYEILFGLHIYWFCESD